MKHLVPFKSDNDSYNDVGDKNTFTDFDTNKSESALNDFNKDESNNPVTSFDNGSNEHTLKDFDSSRGIMSLLETRVYKCVLQMVLNSHMNNCAIKDISFYHV